MLRSTLTPTRPARSNRKVPLSGGGRKNAPSETLAVVSALMINRALDRAVDAVIAARNESVNGRIKRDTMAGILSAMPSNFTRDMIYNREKKRRRVQQESDEQEVLDTADDVVPEFVPILDTTDNVPEFVAELRNKDSGCPLVGASMNEASKRDREERENKAKADAVETLLARWAVRKPGTRGPQNELRQIIEAAQKKFHLEGFLISESMIRERAARGEASNPTSRGPVSPMAEIKPLLVAFVISSMQRMGGKPLDQLSFLEHANSLIKGTAIEEKVLASKRGGESGKANGTRYYQLFMQRHKDEIDSTVAGEHIIIQL